MLEVVFQEYEKKIDLLKMFYFMECIALWTLWIKMIHNFQHRFLIESSLWQWCFDRPEISKTVTRHQLVYINVMHCPIYFYKGTIVIILRGTEFFIMYFFFFFDILNILVFMLLEVRSVEILCLLRLLMQHYWSFVFYSLAHIHEKSIHAYIYMWKCMYWEVNFKSLQNKLSSSLAL